VKTNKHSICPLSDNPLRDSKPIAIPTGKGSDLDDLNPLFFQRLTDIFNGK